MSSIQKHGTSVSLEMPDRGLSDEARDMLLLLAFRLTVDRFSEAVASELAALSYAVRRSHILTITDRGMLMARKIERGAAVQAERQGDVVRQRPPQPYNIQAETLVRYR